MTTPKNRAVYANECVYCGTEFTTQRKGKKYCGMPCYWGRVRTGEQRHGRIKGILHNGSFNYRLALFLEEQGLATEAEITQHLGMTVRDFRRRVSPRSAARDGVPVFERVYGLTAKGKELLARTEEKHQCAP